MAVNFVEKIYQYANVISSLENIISYIDIQADIDAVTNLNEVMEKLGQLCMDCLDDCPDLGKNLWSYVKNITEIQGDLISIGDIIVINILPLIKKWVSSLADIEVDVDDVYTLKSSVSGYLTLYQKTNQLYIHSRNNPMTEAARYVQSILDYSKPVYYVYGCGLGYHLYQLYAQLDGAVRICLYEQEEELLEVAEQYGVLGWIPNEQLEVRKWRGADAFFEEASKEDAAICMHVPSLHGMMDGTEKVKMLTFWMQQNTIRKHKNLPELNAYCNIRKKLQDVMELKQQVDGKDVVVVGAGPSVLENAEQLKRWQGTKIIIAVGTIFKKLLQMGIRPDCVVMIDFNKPMVEQLLGVEQENIPLILSVGAYWKLADIYKGPKYMIYDYRGENAQLLRQMEVYPSRIWKKGGTVSFAAMEAAVHFGAKNIFLCGVDLAYPTTGSHAEGACGYHEMDRRNLFEVPGADGEMVLTDKHLNHYRIQIERRINELDDCTIYNMARHGAYIKGTHPFE